MFDKLDVGMTALKILQGMVFVVDKAIYIIQQDKRICMFLKTAGGAQLSIVGSLFTLM